MVPSWKSWVWKLRLASFLAMGGAIATCGNYAKAQIVPDATLGAERSVVTRNAGGVDAISGGATRGANLFHSFEQFSVLTGRTAYFNNAGAIQNIISRVTGGSVSNIDGLIRANGTAANLFLINPNGIIFGSNASLDIRGSFVASTANSLKFADGSSFSATAPPTTPLLTISVPLGLQFGGTAADINVNGSGLAVPSGKTLALVGGNVKLLGTYLQAPGGRIELGSVAENSLVNLSATDSGWNLGYGGVQNFKDIQLSQGAVVAAPVLEAGGGDVQVQARRLTIQDGAGIAAPTMGSKRGGTLAVRASDSVELSGTGPRSSPSGLFSQVRPGATGNGGNLTIETRQLLVRDGAQVSASTYGAGRAGDLTVKASDSIELSGTGPRNPTSGLLPPSGLFAQVQGRGTGNGGDLRIDTGKLTVLDGAQVATAARNGGQGGNLTINASDSILLSGGVSPTQPFVYSLGRSGLFASVVPGAIGNGGALTITTGNLTVQDGAAIAANTFGSGRAGNAILNVRQLIIRDGGNVGAASFPPSPVGGGSAGGSAGTLTVNASDRVEVSGTGTFAGEKAPSTLSTETRTAGDGGNLNITTGNLNVLDGGQVTVSSTGSGQAGTLDVTARDLSLDNLGALTATTTSGNGGNITLQVPDLLLLRHGSQISTTAGTAQAGGNGGNIKINNPFIVALPSENSDITANAFKGRGGSIKITTQGIFGIEYRKQPTPLSDITASSQFGTSGSVNINTDIVPSQGLVELASAPRVPELIQGCRARGVKPVSRFVNTGRGGLPPNPYEAQGSSEVWRDVQLPRELAENSTGVSRTSTSPTMNPERIVEAQGWIVNQNGNVELVAKMPTVTSQERCDLR